METASTAILLILGMVALANFRNGTLPTWLRSKFLNQGFDAGGGGGFGGTGASGDFSSAGGGAPAPRALSFGLDSAIGKLITPVVGKLTSAFGVARPGHTHEGIDIAAPTGTPIDAAAAGRVIYAGPSSGYGLRVDVDHGNGTVTRYGHLSKIGVRLGQALSGGQVLGLVGATGDATGPHLHFEVRQNGVAVDPAPYLGPIAPGVPA